MENDLMDLEKGQNLLQNGINFKLIRLSQLSVIVFKLQRAKKTFLKEARLLMG